MSRRSNPFQGLEELFERMSRQFEDAARSWEMDTDHGSRLELATRTTSTGIDLAEDGDEFVLTVDVPGYESDDLEIRLSGDVLHVSGERSEDVDEDRENYIRRERRSQSFDRRVQLPTAVDPDDIDAALNNGVLTVTLTKQEDDVRTIDIE